MLLQSEYFCIIIYMNHMRTSKRNGASSSCQIENYTYIHIVHVDDSRDMNF